ncbi:hypothetical protein ANCCEY_07120 [Ancylostoma ceylanicum]|nr:hypothetical protein ANCCEY_07120 [Ancylostoma ceylanicum]
MFDRRLIPFLDNTFKASLLMNWSAFHRDADRMPKMHKLWPPHDNFELAVVYTVALYVFLKCFLTPENVLQVLQRLVGRPDFNVTDEDEKVLGTGHLPSSLLALRLFSAAVVAVSVFTLLLPMQRLAEMHVFVISLNFLHILLTCEMTAVIMFFYAERLQDKVKKE